MHWKQTCTLQWEIIFANTLYWTATVYLFPQSTPPLRVRRVTRWWRYLAERLQCAHFWKTYFGRQCISVHTLRVTKIVCRTLRYTATLSRIWFLEFGVKVFFVMLSAIQPQCPALIRNGSYYWTLWFQWTVFASRLRPIYFFWQRLTNLEFLWSKISRIARHGESDWLETGHWRLAYILRKNVVGLQAANTVLSYGNKQTIIFREKCNPGLNLAKNCWTSKSKVY